MPASSPWEMPSNWAARMVAPDSTDAGSRDAAVREAVSGIPQEDIIDTVSAARWRRPERGRLGLIIPAVESRFTASVLALGGWPPGRARPEVDQINYVTHRRPVGR
jgi:hypothetical protein